MARGERVNVQRTLAFVGFFFFIYSAGKACLFPFLTIYFRHLGLTATQTGIILGLKPFVALLAAPFWVRCAMRHNKRRVILMAAILTLIAANLGLTLIPPVDKEVPLQFCNGEHSNDTDGNSSSYVISPFMDKIGQYVFHADDKEASATHNSLLTSPSTSPSNVASPSSNSSNPNAQVPLKTVTSSSPSDNKVPNIVTVHALLPTSPKTLSSTDSRKETEKVPGEIEGQNSGINGAQNQPSNGYNSDNIKTDMPSSSGWNAKEHNSNNAGVSDSASSSNLDNSNDMDEEAYKHALEYLKERLKSQLDEEDSNKDSGDLLEDNYQVHHFRAKRLSVVENSDLNETENNSLITDENNDLVISETKGVNKQEEQFLQLKYITFMTALVIVILGEILASPADKICDDSLYETLDHIDEVDKYGRHHVVSLVGMGLAAVAVTVAVHFSDCQIFFDANRIMIHFYAFAVLCGIAFLLTFCYPMQDPGKGVHYEKLFRGLVLLLTDFHNIMVVITLLLVGFLSASIQNYMFWLIQDLGGSELTMGLTVTVSALAEIPIVLASGSLTRRLGHFGTLGLAVVAIATRLLYFAYLWTPWAAVPIEILNMFCKGALWESAMLYAEHTAPPGMHRSMQIVMVVLYYGIGSSNGSVVSGLLYDHFGVKVLYCSFAIAAVFWAVVLIMVAKFVPKRRKLHYSKILRDEEDNNNDDLFDSSDDADDWLVNALKNDRF